MSFNEQELTEIAARGSDVKIVDQQIINYKNGFPFLSIYEPATVGNGILQLSDKQIQNMISLYESESGKYVIVKFVPASGAASRMFKELFGYLDEGKETEKVTACLRDIKDFAFYDSLCDLLKEKAETADGKRVIGAMLLPDGLNYGNLPKGLLLFHRYPDRMRTPVEEHLMEGAQYAVGEGQEVRIHFTVSPEHQDLFEELVERVSSIYEEKTGVRFMVSYSQQKASTDTIAVDLDDQPFRNADGSILFRPAGHGALLENLNDLDADIVFIKNIDNVVPDPIKPDTVRFKKAIAGVLLDVQKKVFEYLVRFDHGEDVPLEEVETFIRENLGTRLSPDYWEKSAAEKQGILISLLDRPIRVCGMVKNTGEPGGGPFWVKDQTGRCSLQIVEAAQINLDDSKQQEIMNQATHFNPVDLVVALKDRHGNQYDLLRYRDENTGFITKKSKDGRELKAQELPGLWNGAMAHWNTIFVEVPLITFNPVKTVNDLLRKEHQN